MRNKRLSYLKLSLLVVLTSVVTITSVIAESINDYERSGGVMGSVFQWLGLLLVSVVLAQSALFVARSYRRLAHQEKLNTVSLQLWKSRVSIAEANLKQHESEHLSWSGLRKFEIVRKETECDSIISFYLSPHDKKPIPNFKPGQYLTFSLKIPGESRPTIRCYSLSDCPREGVYRLSIKRALENPKKPPGPSSSCYFHDNLEVGSIIDVQSPSGDFYIDPLNETPVVLIGGGVGLTPVLSMLNAILESGSGRKVYFFYGVTNKKDYAMRKHLQALAVKYANFSLNVCFSAPDENDIINSDYQHKGFVSVDTFKQVLPSNNFEYYLCGPPIMMDTIVGALDDWGVPENKIFFEAFGPASVKKKPAAAVTAAVSPSVELDVEFSKSGEKFKWDSATNSLLDFAEGNGITNISPGCRGGKCGSCETAIISGEVTYSAEPSYPYEAGSCLPCCCTAKSNLVLDA